MIFGAIIDWFTGSKTGRLIGEILLICLVVAVIVFLIFHAGKKSCEVAGLKTEINHAEVRNEVDDSITRHSPGANRDRLRSWVQRSRPGL